MYSEAAGYAEADIQKPAAIECFYCEHSPENLGVIAQALIDSDADIIAIEKIKEGSFGTGTREEKDALSERMTAFLAPDSGITESASEYLDTDEPLFTALLDGLRGSGKRIVLLDMATDDPGYMYYQRVLDLRKEHQERLEQPDKDSPQREAALQNILDKLTVAAAQSYEWREYVMARQLDTLANENPGQKISAMMGAHHTPVSHTLLRTGHKISRTFIPTAEEKHRYKDTEVIRFDEGFRYIRFNLRKFGLSVVDKEAA